MTPARDRAVDGLAAPGDAAPVAPLGGADPARLTRTRHVSARLPEALAEQVELVRIKRRLRHFSDAIAYVLDRGLDAIARLDRKPERMEALVARTEDMTVTVLAILNLVHDLDPDAVARTRAAVLAHLDTRRRPAIPDAEGLSFAAREGDA